MEGTIEDIEYRRINQKIILDGRKAKLGDLNPNLYYIYFSSVINSLVEDDFQLSGVATQDWLLRAAERGFCFKNREFISQINGAPVWSMHIRQDN